MAFVLGIDTATERTVIALGERERDGARIDMRAAADIDAPRAALGRLLPACDEMLRREGLAVSDITEVVVGRGPGSFTGVRIGVATAKGLAHGLGVPLYGVGTLDVVAWGYARAPSAYVADETSHGGLLGVVGDAMRGEVYVALFEVVEGAVSRLEPDRVTTPAEAACEWASLGRPVTLAGDGLAKHGAVFAEAFGPRLRLSAESHWLPAASGLLAAFEHAWAAGEAGSGDVGALLPTYPRLSDAEEAERARGEAPPR